MKDRAGEGAIAGPKTCLTLVIAGIVATPKSKSSEVSAGEGADAGPKVDQAAIRNIAVAAATNRTGVD